MRIWQFWWRSLVVSTQYNPPQFIELVMFFLAMILLLAWVITDVWAYLALGLSYIVGFSISILVRESLVPSTQIRLTQVNAVLLLIVSFYAFVELFRYL